MIKVSVGNFSSKLKIKTHFFKLETESPVAQTSIDVYLKIVLRVSKKFFSFHFIENNLNSLWEVIWEWFKFKIIL